MYLNTTVKIPEIKGKIIAKKKGTTTYILYQYGSESALSSLEKPRMISSLRTSV